MHLPAPSLARTDGLFQHPHFQRLPRKSYDAPRSFRFRRGPRLLVDGKEAPFDPEVIDVCLRAGRGYSMGYDADLRRKSADDIIAFVKQVLHR